MMATVVNRTTGEIRVSQHTPDYDPEEWLIAPALPTAPRENWIVDGERVREMTAAEKVARDVAAAKAATSTRRSLIKSYIDSTDPIITAVFLAFNEVIEELRAIKDQKPKPPRTIDEIKARMKAIVDAGGVD